MSIDDLKINSQNENGKMRGEALPPTSQNSQKLILFQCLLLTFTAILTLPNLFAIAEGGLDPSWIIGLHKARAEGLVHGKDIIFTNGPLCYLAHSIYISRELWLHTLVFNISVQVLFFFSIISYLQKMRVNWVNSLYLVLTIIVFYSHCFRHDVVLISLFIFTYLYIKNKNKKPLVLIFIATLSGIVMYIKFSIGIAALLMLLTFLILLLWEKRSKEALILFLSYISAMLIFGLWLTGSPSGIILFLHNSFLIANGYVDAMAMDGSRLEVLIAILSWTGYISLIVFNILKGNKGDVFFLILASGLLFMSFKHGFIRHDLHVFTFFYTWTMISVLYYLKPSSNNVAVKRIILIFSLILLSVAVVRSPDSFLNWGNLMPAKLQNMKTSINLLLKEDSVNPKEINRKEIGKHYNLQTQTIDLLSGHTVDIFPWDIAIAELYGLKWDPRPVFQSYSAYTDSLDLINEKHFSTIHSPEFLLYSFKSIDERYPIFDEPATFRTVLKNYQPISMDGEFIVLQRNAQIDKYVENIIQTKTSKIGEEIVMPKGVNGYLFARIYMNYNLLGKTARLLYKPPHAYIQFATEGIFTKKYRFIPSTARNGIFLSQYIADQNDLFNVWNGKLLDNFDSIIISARNSYFYDNRIAIEFFEVPKKTVHSEQN